MSNIIPLEVVDQVCRKFINWLDTAKKGDKYCYHTGAHISGSRVARMAFQAYEKRRVILYQRREQKEFSYWAEKT